MGEKLFWRFVPPPTAFSCLGVLQTLKHQGYSTKSEVINPEENYSIQFSLALIQEDMQDYI